MTQAKYKEEESNIKFAGDSVHVAGTLTVDGVSTLTGGTAGGTLKLVSGPSGTNLAPVWTSGAPVLSAGSQYITVTAGSTTYRIPVWANS